MSVVLITGSCGLVGSESVKYFASKKTLKAIHNARLKVYVNIYDIMSTK